jgi:hypothetical protein
MRRRGDPRAILQLGLQRMGQEFARERDAVNFAQSMQMRGLDRAFMQGRDAQQRQDALDAEGRQNARRDAEWQRNRDAELQDRATQGIDSAFTMTSPDGKYVAAGVKTKGGEFKPFMVQPVPAAKETMTSEDIVKQIQGLKERGIEASYGPGGFSYQPHRPPASGWETSNEYDQDGRVKKSTRKPIGADSVAGSRTSGLGLF